MSQKTSRPIFSGTLTLGKVAVPVTLHVAQSRDEISFTTLHATCSSPISQKRWCKQCDRELGAGETVKGYEFSPGQYVLGDDVATPTSDVLELARFVPLADVDPLYLDRTYFVQPVDDDASRHAYIVVAAALERTRMGGIGTFVLYRKPQLALVSASNGILRLSTLYTAADIRPVAHVDDGDLSERETRLAAKLVRDRAAEFDPATLTLPGRDEQRAAIDAKIAAGETITAAGAHVAPVDLADALRQSVRKPRRKAAVKK